MADVRNRISEIQRRIGVSAAWGGGGPGWSNPVTAPNTSFARQLGDATAAGASAGATAAAGSTLPPFAAAATTDPSLTLAEALGTTPVYATKPNGLPAVGVNDTMAAAGNGNLPDSLLASIGGEFRLAKPAADAYQRMVNAARRDGVTFGVSDAYRSYADQVDIAGRLGLYGQGGLAAVPGTSNHGWGLSLDLDLDDRAQAWMRDNGWRYGYFEDVAGEPWHWTYRA
ncbi:MAG: M15 family metallopeptidase [Acidimicrobiales bacterium]|nr:M15 family metallopeptidase [Acidimicrobiales bacterium]